MVVGIFAPGIAVPGGQPKKDSLNRVWAELSQAYGYSELQFAPDGTGARMLVSEEDSVVIQPPLIQVRDRIQLTAAQSAEKAADILKIVSRQLGIADFFNLGVKHVYHAPAPGNDGRSFVLNRLLGRPEDELADLRGGGEMWVGLKYVVSVPDATYTLVVEPLLADPKLLFIDLDAQQQGPTNLDTIKDRAAEAERFLTKTVNAHLDKAAGGLSG